MSKIKFKRNDSDPSATDTARKTWNVLRGDANLGLLIKMKDRTWVFAGPDSNHSLPAPKDAAKAAVREMFVADVASLPQTPAPADPNASGTDRAVVLEERIALLREQAYELNMSGPGFARQAAAKKGQATKLRKELEKLRAQPAA